MSASLLPVYQDQSVYLVMMPERFFTASPLSWAGASYPHLGEAVSGLGRGRAAGRVRGRGAAPGLGVRQ